MDVAPGDTVYIVDPTPYHVVRFVVSTNSVMIHPAFDSRRCSFFVVFSALWAPPKPVTELAVNTDPIKDCNLRSPVPPPVLPDAMDVSTITTPPLTSTVSSITDWVEHREFAALLREADELERLEEQLKERSNQLGRQQERLAPTTTTVNHLLLGFLKMKPCGAISVTPSPAWRTCRKQANSLKSTTTLSACSFKLCLASLKLLTALPLKIVTTSLD